MIRFAFAAVAATILTTGTVAALASPQARKASVDEAGNFCLRMPIADTTMERLVCKSSDDWAAEGIQVVPRRK